MRRMTYFVATSLDCFIAGENWEIDWLVQEGDFGFKAFYDSIETIVMGHNTYKSLLAMGPYPHTDKETIVLTRWPSHDRDEFGSRFIGNATFAVKELLEKEGGNVWLVGGGDIAGQLATAGLLKEMTVTIHPILLGKGIPLFANLKKRVKLKAQGSELYPNGLLQVHYHIGR